jgi:hypothetical protein
MPDGLQQASPEDLGSTGPIDAEASTPTELPGYEEDRPRRRLSPQRLGLVAAVAGVLLFAVLWRVEASHHSSTRHDLRESRAEVKELQTVRTNLLATLAQSQRLSQRRAAVLLRTKAVLRSVDPLLSSVDELQSITGKIQTSRDNATTASDTLVNDLLDMSNYLISAGSYADYTYVGSLISGIRSDIDTLNGYYSQLSGYDSRYDAAGNRFGTRATALTKDVQALNKQLTDLSE